MFRKLLYLASVMLVLVLSTSLAIAGVEYGEPDGGWTYIYTGDAGAAGADFTALDGTWSHDNGSDSWDESQIGSGLPGGVNVLTEDGVTYLRLQETGDPRDHGASDPSNRKIYFGHSLSDEIPVEVADTILDNGVTISFRARLSTTPPLDDAHPDGGGVVTPWPAGGDGYVIHDGGKGNFGICQTGPTKTISFCLALASDDDELETNGLVMNKLNGTSPSGDVDLQGDEPGTVNIFPIEDLTTWREFWITIKADDSGLGTHVITIYLDGDASASSIYHVTAGSSSDLTGTCLALGVGATPQTGAIDVDFFAYKEGIVTPVSSNPFLARAVNPASGATVALHDATPFGWTPGEGAVQHDVYLGTVEADVNDADVTDTTGIYRGRLNMPIFNPDDALDLGQTYFWRIDEVEADGTTIHKGLVWSFSVIGFLPVDDFESYTDDDLAGEAIWQTWIDGFGVAENGAQAGYLLPPYAERTIVNSDSQSMPVLYNNASPALYSEAVKTLSTQRDWTEQGVKALTLWFRGYPPRLGSFTEGPVGTYTVTAEGADIAGTSDQFHFAWKEASGAVEIVAKVESIQNTDGAAKAGVMIRDSLEADSAHAMVAVTPGSGVWFGYRNGAGQGTTEVTQDGITAPQWVRLERTVGGLVRAYYSADGVNWTLVSTTSTVSISLPIYVGLAVTSHNPGVPCEAVFSNVTSAGTGQWVHQDVGLISNDAQPMYVAIANKNGPAGTVYHDNPEATLISTWTEWNIDLKDFSDQGVNLADVDSIAIGVGDRNNPQSDGSGTVFFDDIRLYRPRYIPDKVVPLVADFTNDGVVDHRDLGIMMGDWLDADYTIYAQTPEPAGAVWSFENNVNDSAGANNGVAYGNPTYGTGTTGRAIRFDGINDYIVVTDSPQVEFGTGSFSIALWVKSSFIAGSDKQFILCNGTNGSEFDAGGIGPDGRSSGKRYVLKFEDSDFRFTLDDDAAKTVVNGSSDNFAIGDWVHAVAIRDDEAKEIRIYCNGELASTAPNPSTGDLSSPGEPLFIGAKQQENAHAANSAGAPIDHFFEGILDELQIYDYALSQAEILSLLGLSEQYVPLTSQANISDDEPVNSKSVNLKDFAVLADEWLNQLVWPAW